MSESPTVKHRRDASVVALALLCSAVLAVVVGAGSFFWNELEQSKADNAALASQVRSLGGQPVAEGKPGQSGKDGEPGARGPVGPQGPQGPPGIQGSQGPIGVTGRSPQCLLEPSRCVGATGGQGVDGAQGPQGEQGPAGATGDQGPAGPQGEQGPAGADGAKGDPGEVGEQGEKGRGITGTKCQDDGTWLFTYSDGSSETVQGPCRISLTPN